MTDGKNDTAVLHQWTARKVSPIIFLGVIGVFASFMLLSYFVFHSMSGVKALITGTLGAVVSLSPAVLQKMEYRFTDLGLQKRSALKRRRKKFKEVFRWDELDHVVPTRQGFRYSRPIPECGAFRLFWKKHFSDAYSGEFRAEASDHAKVLEILAERRIPGA